MRNVLLVLGPWLLAALAPVAQAQATISPWMEVGLPAATVIAAGASNPDVLLALRSDADPARSTDGGVSWAPFTVQGTRPDRLVASPVDPSLFYALTGNVLAHGFGDSPALYRSTDAGATWQLVRTRLEAGVGTYGSPWLGSLKLGAEPGLVYATRMEPSFCSLSCSFEGAEAFRSTDGGATWQSIDSGFGNEAFKVRALHPSPSDANVVYGVTRYGIFRSDDRGDSWRVLRSLDSDNALRQLVVDARDSRTVYARFDDHAQFWVTEDGGATWRTTDPVPVPGPNRHLVADPVQAGRLYLMGLHGEILESRDRARTWMRVAPGDTSVVVWDPYEFADESQTAIAIAIADGARVFFARGGSDARRTVVREDAMALGSDLWWNPAQSGAGWSITQHASGQMFVVWYGYDAQGAPIWRAMPGGTWTDGRTFTGALYTATGPAFFQQPFNSSAVTVKALGTATLRFDDSDNATFSYSLASGPGEVRITRQLFGPMEVVSWRPENYADLWWNASESGWGLAFSQQYSTAFATWYVYDAAGDPLWVVMPDGRLGSETIGQNIVWNFFGDIYTTRGPKFGEPFDPAQVVVTPIGKASIAFDGPENAILTYTLGAPNETRRLTRQPF